MPSFTTPPRFGFGAAPTADLTPTLCVGPKSSGTTAASPIEKQPAVSPPTGLVFATVSIDTTGKQITKKIPNPAYILDGYTHILRVYLSLEDLPPKPLHGMFLHFQKQGTNPLQEVHLCVRSLLRPCLQDIDEDRTLQERMLFMISQWTTFGNTFKFFFHRLGVEVGRDRFQNFVEKDLVRAIHGLKEHDFELSEILGEESWIYGQKATASEEVPGARGVAGDNLVDEMI